MGDKRNQCKGVYVHQTGEVFSSCKEAAIALGINIRSFSSYIKGTKKCPKWVQELQIEIFEKEKVCCNCGKSLKNENKYKSFICSKCLSEQKKKYYQKNKDQHLPRYFKKEFGITVEDREQMFEDQQGCCAICGEHESSFKKRLSVDHNHKTGKVRGLLCGNCNRALGYLLADNGIDILCSAISYIRNTDG